MGSLPAHGIMVLENPILPILPGLHTLHLIAISTHTYYTSVGRSHLMVEECVSGSENASKGTTGQPTVSISRLVCHIYGTLS
jgi:hypothetical protein